MQDFFNKLGKTAVDVANKAGNKAEELVEVGKLKSKVSSLKSDLSGTKKELGERCYDLFRDDENADDTVKSLCEKIDSLKDEIASLEEEISNVRSEYKEKRESEYDGDTL